MDANYREPVRAQHADFNVALERRASTCRSTVGRPGTHAAGVRAADSLRAAADPPAGGDAARRRRRPQPRRRRRPDARRSACRSTTAASPSVSAARRSTSRRASRFYLPDFAGRRNVLDIGCGRGEFLEMMRARGCSRARHRSQPGVGRSLPTQGPGGRKGRPVRLPGGAAGGFARRHLLRAGGGASAAGAAAGDDPAWRRAAWRAMA